MGLLARAWRLLLIAGTVLVVAGLLSRNPTSEEVTRASLKELCAAPGRSGVDMNIFSFYEKKHPGLQQGTVGLQERWDWYYAQLDPYSEAQLTAASCDDETVRHHQARRERRETAARKADSARTLVIGTPCTNDPRTFFAAGQRVSSPEFQRRLAMHCPGAQPTGAVTMVSHNGQTIAIELEPALPAADDYFNVRSVDLLRR